MNRTTAAAALTLLLAATSAMAQTYGPDTPFKELMANPQARAILQAEIPIIVMAYDAGRIDEAGSLRIASQIESAREQGGLTPEVYARILRQLAGLPSAAAPPATAQAKYGPNSTFRQMMADPKARALLDKHIPLVMGVFDSGMSEDTVTLQRVSENPQAQDLGGFTPEVYKALLADLAKL